MTNRQAFATALAVLGNTFDRKLTAPAIEGYWTALGDLTEPEFLWATKRALVECRFMPTPAELRAFARPPCSLEARSAAAWIAVRAAIRKHDYTVASIDFGPLTNTVLRAMGSWSWLCELGDEAMKWEAKRFAELFAAFASGPETALRPEPLEGWGRGRVGCEAACVAIEGEIAPLDPRRTLEAPASPMGDLVRKLAEEKSHDGVTASPDRPALKERAAGASAEGLNPGSAMPSPRRETKPPIEITEAEKAEAIARMAALLEARGANP